MKRREFIAAAAALPVLAAGEARAKVEPPYRIGIISGLPRDVMLDAFLGVSAPAGLLYAAMIFLRARDHKAGFAERARGAYPSG
jgi:hypothetical protein